MLALAVVLIAALALPTAADAAPARNGERVLPAIAAGCDTTVVARADGTIWAWGDNAAGQLGNGTVTSSATPTQVLVAAATPLTDVIAVAQGCGTGYALRADGAVFAWGGNDHGQLGTGTATGPSTCGASQCSRYAVRVQVGAGPTWLTDVTAIAAGAGFAVVRRSDGTAWAWGRGSSGQLGNQSTSGPATCAGEACSAYAIEVQDPAAASGRLTGVVDVAAGDATAIAQLVNGTVVAWGSSSAGATGVGTTTGATLAPTLVQLDSGAYPAIDRVRGIDGAGRTFRALRSDGTLLSWGAGAEGQLGNATTTTAQPRAVEVLDPALATPLTRVRSIGGGPGHGIAVRADGSTWAWGRNAWGQLGDVSQTQRTRPVQVADSSTPTSLGLVLRVDGGSDHSVAVRADGSTWTWGSDRTGQLGLAVAPASCGTENCSTWARAAQLGAGTGHAAVAAAEFTSYAIRADGTVWSWGENGDGELGIGVEDGRTSRPQQVLVSAGVPLAGIVALAGGPDHAMALRADGTVWSWGDNGVGQLAIGSTTDSNWAVQARSSSTTFLTDVIQVAAADNMSLFLQADGRVHAAGRNSYGTLGDDTTSNRSYPVLVQRDGGTQLDRVVSIGGDGGSTDTVAAVRDDGTAWTWGQNSDGELGLGGNAGPDTCGSTACSRQAVQVLAKASTPMVGVLDVGASYEAMHLLTASGEAWSWGSNETGQVGNATTSPTFVPYPRRVATNDTNSAWLAGATRLASGDFTPVVLRSDGRVLAWGENVVGNVGDGTTASPRTWATGTLGIGGVGVLGMVTDVGSGGDHSIARDAAGRVMTWGADTHGQLGSCSTTWAPRLVPEVLQGSCGNQPPFAAPMAQYLTDGTGLPFGTWTDQTTIRVAGNATDPNGGDQLRLFVEIRPVSVAFSSTCGDTTDTAVRAGATSSAITLGDDRWLTVDISGLVNGTQYHWRSCVVDQNGARGPWFVPPGSPHISIDTTVAPTGTYGVRQVAAACDSTGTVLADGSVWMAGEGSLGQLGNGSTSGSSATPVQVRMGPSGATALENVRSLDVGCGFAVAVRADGTVWAWGSNSTSQLGGAAPTTCGVTPCSPYAVQVDPTSVSAVGEVSAGTGFALALRADGRVLAWGDNAAGQLGRGSTGAPSATAAPVRNTANTADLVGVTSIAAGAGFGAASDVNGAAWTWGRNDDTRLGAGVAAGNHPTAQAVLSAASTPLRRVLHVTVGDAHALALRDDGTLHAWGRNDEGQLGIDSVVDAPYASPVRDAAGVTMARFVAVAGGALHTVARRADGTVWAWGSNTQGQLSQATTTGASCGGTCEDTPVPIRDSAGAVVPVTASNFRSVAAGASHSVALEADSETWAWGSDTVGQLGRGAATGSTTSLVTTAFSTGQGFVQSSMSAWSGLALQANGIVRSWGDNAAGQLGNGQLYGQTPRLQTVETSAGVPLTHVVQIFAVEQGGYALRADGSVWAWGAGGSGRLGNNGNSTQAYAVQVRAASGSINTGAPLADVTGIAGHDEGGLAVDSAGQAWSWGDNDVGDLGSGACCTSRYYAGHVVTAGLAPLNRVASVGGSGTEGDDVYAVRSDGTVWAWGQNNDGQLGQGSNVGPQTCGTTPCSTFALQVQAAAGPTYLTGVVDVTAADGAVMVRRADGTVWAWGEGGLGELGNNGTSDRAYPVQVRTTSGTVDTGTPLANVLSVAAGDEWGMAVRADGSMVSWGHNSTGQLGIGSTSTRTYAVPSTDAAGAALTNMLEASQSGYDHAGSLDAAGRVRTSGANYHYQLADCVKVQRTRYLPIRTDCGAANRPPDVRWLEQYDAGFNRIPSGGWTSDGITTNMHIGVTVSDPDNGETVTPYLELRPVGEAFDATCGDTTNPNVRAGTAQSMGTTGDGDSHNWAITGLTIGTQYHWRVCAVDAGGAASYWDEFGSMPFPDFGVDDSLPANPTRVDDGAERGVDVDTSYSLNTLEATWPYGIDAGGSGLVSYDYCVTIDPAGADCGAGAVRTWTFNGYDPEVRATGLTLTHGSTYHMCVRAIDGAGNKAIGFVCSDGQQVRFAFTAVNPNAGVQGEAGVLVELTGEGFLSTDAVTFSGTGITVQSVTRISDTRLDVVIDIAAGATAGARDVRVARTGTDTSQVTRTGAFTVVALSITINVSTLGYDDAARDGTAPNAVGFGSMLPGDTRQVGPAGSGQATAGAAAEVTVVANGPWRLQATGTDFSDGIDTVPASALSWKHFGVTEAWTPFSTSAATIEGAGAGNAANDPGGTTYAYDWQMVVPALQAPGAYSGTVTYTAIPAV